MKSASVSEVASKSSRSAPSALVRVRVGVLESGPEVRVRVRVRVRA